MAVERLSIQQVMDELHCSEQTVYRLMREGLLGYTQVTPTVRLVRRDELDAYLDNRDVIGKFRKAPRLSSHLNASLDRWARTPVNLAASRKRA